MKKLFGQLKTAVVKILKRNKTQGRKILDDPAELNDAIERVLATNIQESSDLSTYTINKKDVYLCDPDFINVDKNTIVHILLHELAHSANNTIGHDEKWQKMFNDILHEAGHSSPPIIDLSVQPKLTRYCDGNYAG